MLMMSGLTDTAGGFQPGDRVEALIPTDRTGKGVDIQRSGLHGGQHGSSIFLKVTVEVYTVLLPVYMQMETLRTITTTYALRIMQCPAATITLGFIHNR